MRGKDMAIIIMLFIIVAMAAGSGVGYYKLVYCDETRLLIDFSSATTVEEQEKAAGNINNRLSQYMVQMYDGTLTELILKSDEDYDKIVYVKVSTVAGAQSTGIVKLYSRNALLILMAE